MSFRLATCHDFINLEKEHDRSLPSTDSCHTWGLKQLGKRFVLDQIVQLSPHSILEIGGGTDISISTLSKNTDYWMIDDGSRYPNADEYNAFKERWGDVKLVNGLMGGFKKELPEAYFDFTFSISALEHTPREQKSIEDVCRDIYRITKSGGCSFHTIDIVPCDPIANWYKDAFVRAGFSFIEEPRELKWDVGNIDQQIFLESFQVEWNFYQKSLRDRGASIKWHHFGSVLVGLRKP
jgi:ubiquinone/menaquinone biosynthesis C-methylase UbiE